MKHFAAACFVLLLLNIAGRVESRAVADDVAPRRPHHHRHRPRNHRHHRPRPHKLFVFGDDFADNGNSASDEALGSSSRSWRYPFGMSDTARGRKPTGRYSDGLVQSDFLAKIMGHSESPPAYMSRDNWDDDGGGGGIDASGMNFAVADARALEVTAGNNISAQVQQLRNLVTDGLIDDRDLEESVALIGYSGNDYASANSDNMDDLVAKVVEELASVVSQLQDLGVAKVVVNTVPPFGCSPWLAVASNYSSCDDNGNVCSDKHNTALRGRLGGKDDDGVMLLDVNSIITNLVAPKEGSALYAGQFTAERRLRPCCEGTGDDGFCGKDGGGYTLCDNPDKYFFWDDVHPTHAGWRAIMQLLQGPIMAFLGISNLQHF